MEKFQITVIHGKRDVRPRRQVAIGKLGPGIARILVVSEFVVPVVLTVSYAQCEPEGVEVAS